jgi:ABC-type transport system involved in cytochrome c biogenesis permease subunit
VLTRRAPALSALDEFAARTILFALPALTLGVLVGLVRVREENAGFDALMAVTAVTWSAYVGYLALRHLGGWRGRRAAFLALAGFALVIVARLGFTHFS